jgi:hypothetical protein
VIGHLYLTTISTLSAQGKSSQAVKLAREASRDFQLVGRPDWAYVLIRAGGPQNSTGVGKLLQNGIEKIPLKLLEIDLLAEMTHERLAQREVGLANEYLSQCFELANQITQQQCPMPPSLEGYLYLLRIISSLFQGNTEDAICSLKVLHQVMAQPQGQTNRWWRESIAQLGGIDVPVGSSMVRLLSLSIQELTVAAIAVTAIVHEVGSSFDESERFLRTGITFYDGKLVISMCCVVLFTCMQHDVNRVAL